MVIKSILPKLNPLAGAAAKSKAKAKPIKAKVAKATSAPADALESTNKSAAVASITPTQAPSAPSIPGVSETFPVQALESLDAKGLSGQTFMLDGGSLRGLKLRTRRIIDGDKPGFEILFKLTSSKIPGLLEKLDKAGASTTDLSFRGLELGEDGVAKLNAAKGVISTSSTHAPPDLDNTATKWVRRLEDQKGGVIEVVNDKAALAVRGLVRIQLSGDDKTCNKQLDGLIKSLGLQSIFAPPTTHSKQVHALMHVLWQVDSKQADKLAKGDLDKVKPADLVKTLEKLGYSKERISGLRYEDTFEGHFSVVDPQQAEELAKAGARYLYSTVTSPEHVLSILRNGQKSSLQRYEDGMIVNGMSTIADFSTGGAVGVFTRLVTQDAIYNGQGWTGRTYKLLQSYKQLGRTDWYGWNGDYFGRRWDLDSKVNFGRGLVESIDDGKTYKTTNELIFTAGNRPENIERVIATTESDRQKLIEHLEKQGYQPHNGLSLSEFVVLSPKFLPYGPSPYDVTDPKKFASEALAAAKTGSSAQLRWFLIEGPADAGAKAELEKKCLLDPKLRQYALDAAKISGRFAMAPEELGKLIKQLKSKKTKEGPKILEALVKSAAEALFRSGAKEAAALLASKPSKASYPGPYELSDDVWVRIYESLAKLEGGTTNPCFELAMKTRAEKLLKDGNAGFRKFLQSTPLVNPADPAAWLAAEAKKVAGGGESLELALFVAQTQPDSMGQVRKQLLAADGHKTVEILRSTLVEQKDLGMSGQELNTLLDSLPADSASKKVLFDEFPDALLRTGDADLLAKLEAHHGTKSPQLAINDSTRWTQLAEALVAKKGALPAGFLSNVLGRGAYWLQHSAEFMKRLGELDHLFDLSDPTAYLAEATQNWKAGSPAPLKLMWLLLGPEETRPFRAQAAVATLRSNDYYVRNALHYAKTYSGKDALPLDAAELNSVMKQLTDDPKDANAKTTFLSTAGRQILTKGDATSFGLLKAHFEKNPSEDPAGQLGVSYAPMREVLDELAARKDDLGKQTYRWLVETSASHALKTSRTEFIAHVLAQKLDLSDLALDLDKALALVKQIAESQYYYGTQSISEGTKWLLFRGAKSPDDALMEKIIASIDKWKFQPNQKKGFIDALSELAPDWKAKLQTA
ncbi:MAG: hypothetical protein HY791_02560 [Deltaproteobacteria bacterium]|nr:hypothetical protein [Deltaproteobacteria bacterium]